MSDRTIAVGPKATSPHYLGWRGTLLAKLALARVPGLVVNEGASDHDYDFLVATPKGACFFVAVKAFSSMRLEAEDVDTTAEWRWRIDAALIRRARESRSPFFLFDADTDHGRSLRLDTLPAPGPEARTVMVRIPRENALGRKHLEEIVAELEAARAPR